MERRTFVKNSLAATGLSAFSLPPQAGQAANKQYYELRTYELKSGGKQSVFEEYFTKAFIPTLNKMGVSQVGIFTEMGMPEPPKLYVLIPYQNLEQFGKVTRQMSAQSTYKNNSKAYFESATPDNPNFTRYQSSLMLAFDVLPQMKTPAKGERLFELRTYESFDEDAAQRKIAMFNKEELPIFYDTGLTPVFFGETLIGDKLPQLTYMLVFKDMEERDQNWQKFIQTPEWKRISALPEYADSVSRVNRTFLKPTAYSQV